MNIGRKYNNLEYDDPVKSDRGLTHRGRQFDRVGAFVNEDGDFDYHQWQGNDLVWIHFIDTDDWWIVLDADIDCPDFEEIGPFSTLEEVMFHYALVTEK